METRKTRLFCIAGDMGNISLSHRSYGGVARSGVLYSRPLREMVAEGRVRGFFVGTPLAAPFCYPVVADHGSYGED